MVKKSKNSMFIVGLFILSMFVVSTAFAAEVPFEVVKTYVTAEAKDIMGHEAVVVDGVLQDDNFDAVSGTYDTRVKIPVESVNYKIEFWNVGEMGGEKGFIFKSSYGKAKLTRTYELGQAYRYVEGKEEFMGIKSVEVQEVGTPDVDTTFVDELTFSGGPYGKFYYTDKKGIMWQIAHVSQGREIIFDNVPENTDPKKPRYLMGLAYAMDVRPDITDSSAFEKWMEILNQQPGCQDPSDPKTDSGWRFTDYQGEVMVRPCDDEDAWYGAELDMVIHRSDHIRNGDDSTCKLMSTDMTLFLMNKPESEIIVSYSEEESKVHLIWGKIKVNVERMLKDGTMDVEMSQAVAGIKGTIFVVEETGTESTLKVIDGEVEFTSKATGKSEMIGSGEMITATNEGLEKKENFDINKEDATWESNEAMINDVKNHSDKSGILTPLIVIILLVILLGGYFLIKQKNWKMSQIKLKKFQHKLC